jgi:ATP-dependent exoDNAse (exonuclease V) beta subunit
VRLSAVLSRLGDLPRGGRPALEQRLVTVPLRPGDAAGGPPPRADDPPAATGAPTPTDSQWRAIREVDRHVLITAGAGTGKTYTVVGKVLFLLGVEVRGERIAEPLALHDVAAITYTNRAAKELKQDLRTALRAAGRTDDAYEVDLARIGTIHSFCGDLIRTYALRAGRTAPGEVLEEGVALERATEAARDALVEALEDRSIPGLDALLAGHKTADVDRWLVDLMRRADLVRALRASPACTGPERVLVELAVRALARYETQLQREGVIDFDRMVLWTRDLLRDDASIRSALQRRIRVLIIDEFQDVDPVQKEIAYLLGEPASRRADTTRLVFVGDPKQSIYRFRGADVAVWSSVEADFEARDLGMVLPLEENRRSVPAILGFIEATIGRTLDAPLDGATHQPYEVPFRAVRPVRAAGARHAVEILVAPPADKGGRMNAQDARALEAEAIAQRAVALHAEGTPWQDMAVLLSAWTRAHIYRAALERAGVPVYMLRGEGFYDTREVMDLVLALEVVRDPEDDRALIGFLRSPFVGLRDESIAALALAHYAPYARRLDEVALPDEREQARLARAAAWIDDWGVLRDRMSAPALLTEILDRTGYLGHHALRGENGAQAIANVRQFLAFARASGDIGVGDLLRVVKERRARQDRVAEARLHAESDPVLTIASIHVAKGLEWPVVFWADLSNKGRTFGDRLVVLRDRIALGQPDTTVQDQPADWQAERAAYLLEEDAEDRRQWYVAATRARDRLFVSGLLQGNAKAHAAEKMLFGAMPSLATARDGDVVRFGASFLTDDGHGQGHVHGHGGGAASRAGWIDSGAASTDQGQGQGQGQVQDGGAAMPAFPADSGGAAMPASHADARGAAGVGSGVGFEAVVRVLSTAQEEIALVEEPATYATARVGDPASLEVPPPPVVVPVGPPKLSATALLARARCPRRYFFKYVAGLEEPAVPFMKKQIVSAVARGQIVHDVLERWQEEAELAALLEDAIGRFDDNAPPPDTTPGRKYRGELRDEVERVLDHASYSGRLARPGARRELGFLYVHDDATLAQGSIDLATPDATGQGIELVDVKTSQCDAAAAQRKAAEYAPQRDVYATAAAAIAGAPVTRFGFLFSKPGVDVEEEIDPTTASQLRARFAERAAAAACGDYPLTTDPAECRWCGFHRVKLCPGIISAEGA